MCSGGLRGIWFRGGREERRGEGEKGGVVFGFWFFGSSSGLESEAERYYLVDVMQIYIYIYIGMVGMLSSVLHYIYHVLANELPPT